MQEKDFRFIENAATEEGVATITLFTGVNEESAKRFVDEFKWLEGCEPKRIDIKINSAGGSVLHGWSIIDAIMASKVPTRAIVVGVAASMASVILAAADEAWMMSYASIMVHNPFFPSGEKTEGAEVSPQIATFRAQLIDMYTKRWGKSEAEVEALMDGEEGKDGTWFKSQQAHELGIVSKVVSIEPQAAQRFTQVQSEVAIEEMAVEQIQAKFQEVLNDLQLETKESDMKDVKAKLGLSEETDETAVLAQVSALMESESALQETVNSLTETLNALQTETATLKVEAEGAKAVIEQANAAIEEKETAITELQAKVTEYESEKNAAELARRESIVNAAIEEGKINSEDKDNWITLFNSTPEATEKVLNQLQGVGKKKKLSEQTKDVLNKDGQPEEKPLPTVDSVMDEIESNRRK